MQEYPEFSKIDIHQHFGGNHTFDRAINEKYDKVLFFNWTDSVNLLKDARESKFNILAMTNQNVFDSEKFLLMRKMFRKESIELIPGIEINLFNNENNGYLHTVVLFNPDDNLVLIQIKIEEYISNNQKNCLTLDNLIDLLLKRKVIFIPHGIKQSGGGVSLSENPELIDVCFALEDAFPVFIEDNQKYHKETLKEQVIDFLDEKKVQWLESTPSVSGGDRKKPSQIVSPTYIWGDKTFADLYYCSLMNDGVSNPRIKRDTDIIRKIGYIRTIRIKKSSKTFIEDTTLECSHGLNTIVGSSGSGKTLLLSLINRKILNKEIKNKTITKDYSDISSVTDITLYNEKGDEIGPNEIGVFEGDNLYLKIIEAYDSDKDKLLKQFGVDIKFEKFNDIGNQFENKINVYINKKKEVRKYTDQIKTILNNIVSTVEFLKQNKNQSSFNITYSLTENFLEMENILLKKRAAFSEDLNQINKSFDAIVKIVKLGKYISADKVDMLTSIKDDVVSSINESLIKLNIESIDLKIRKLKKMNLMNKAQANNKKMGELNNQIGLNQQYLLDYNSKLMTSLKVKYANERYNSVPFILASDVKSSIQLGKNDYAKISMKEPSLSYKKENITSLFPNHVGQNKSLTKLGLSSFSKTEFDLSKQEDVRELLDPFCKFDFTGSLQFVLPQQGTIDYEILLTTIDGNDLPIENITAGSLSKIYIKKMFDDNLKDKGTKTIIIYDQPDTNMEKAFILDELVEKIKDLKNHYQIFITTHEPLLVINADANNIIRAENNKMISNKINIKYSNIGITGVASKSEAFTTISRLIDGNYKAVKFRSKIYGGMISENRN